MFLLFFQFLDSILDIRTDTALKGKSHEKPLFQANWHICILQPEKSNFPRLSCCWTLTKGSILVECGHALQTIGKYEVKVFNTINFSKSMHYNPFAYIHSEKDILKLVTTLIANTKGDGKSADEFWTKAETLLYCALDRIFDDATVFKLRGESFRGKKLETVSLQTGKVQAVEPVPTPDE